MVYNVVSCFKGSLHFFAQKSQFSFGAVQSLNNNNIIAPLINYYGPITSCISLIIIKLLTTPHIV